MDLLPLDDAAIESLSIEHGQKELYDRSFPLPGSFGLRVGKGGRKAFFAILRVNGRRKRLTLGMWPLVDVESARRRAIELAAEVERGRDPSVEYRRQKQAPRFERFAMHYLAEIAAAECRPSTLREYERLLKKEVFPEWRDLSIADIAAEDVAALLAEIGFERGHVPLANRVRALLSGIFSYGLRARLLSVNPVKDTSRIAEEPKSRQPLELEQLLLLWELLNTRSDRLSLALRMLLLSAQRLSDVLKMRWSDLKIDAWMPGGDLTRPLHLHASILSALRSIQHTPGAELFVFADAQGRPPRDLRKLCHGLAQETGFEQLNPSLVRQSVELQFQRLGAGPELLAYLMGRRSILKQLGSEARQEELFNQSQKLMARWLRTLSKSSSPPSPGPGKVIPLFKD